MTELKFLSAPTIVSVSVSIVFMLVAAALYWPMHQLAFISDDSPVSWLSSAQLWAIAVISLRYCFDKTIPLYPAMWLCAAMVLLAFDEQFMFHEQWKFGCLEWLSICEYQWVRELPMILVALFGAATIIWLHDLVPLAPARAVLWSAFGVGALAISLDLIPWFAWLVRYEEAVEVLAEAVFLGYLLGLQRITYTRQIRRDRSGTNHR